VVSGCLLGRGSFDGGDLVEEVEAPTAPGGSHTQPWLQATSFKSACVRRNDGWRPHGWRSKPERILRLIARRISPGAETFAVVYGRPSLGYRRQIGLWVSIWMRR